MGNPICCFIDDEANMAKEHAAEFTLWAGDGMRPDDYTEVCAKHIGDLITDAYIHHIHPIEVVGASNNSLQ